MKTERLKHYRNFFSRQFTHCQNLNLLVDELISVYSDINELLPLKYSRKSASLLCHFSIFRLLNKFRFLLNPRQVFNLAEGGPLAGYEHPSCHVCEFSFAKAFDVQISKLQSLLSSFSSLICTAFYCLIRRKYNVNCVLFQ